MLKIFQKIKTHYLLISGIFTLKIVALVLFSSDYMQQLFVPFVQHFTHNFGNPWQYFFDCQSAVEFPYHPLMLYLLSLCYLPLKLLGINGHTLASIALKLPTLCADLSITYLLLKTFPTRTQEVAFFYCASPIIFYAAYLHSQLDLIPTAILFLSIYLLKQDRVLFASLALGCALSTKLHVIAAAPIMAIYVLKNYSFKKMITFSTAAFAVYCFFVAPFIVSTGYYHLVLTHPKQMLLFDVFAQFGSLKLYLPICALLTLYGRFFTYDKINNDLMDAFLGIVFSFFVLLIIPAPAWYMWMLPFLSTILIKQSHNNANMLWTYAGLNGLYFLFFIFFYQSNCNDLLFLGTPVNFKIHHQTLCNITFTLLEATLLLLIYCMYKFGVRSNAIYKKGHSLIIGIGGDSGAGKSTFMHDLHVILGAKATILEGDGDHRWERNDTHWQEFTHLDPKANYLHRQAENLLSLKMGQAIKRTDYNHTSGTFDPARLIKPTDFICLSGLHPLYLPKMRKLIDVKIYLDPAPDIRAHWKIVRDMHKRGYSKEKVIEQLNKRAIDGQKYIEPQKNFSDLIVHYFTDQKFEVGNPHENPLIKLKITLDSSVRLDPLIQELTKANINFAWDYAADLSSQYVILSQPIAHTVLPAIAQNVLINIEELTVQNNLWAQGYRGFLQLITLLIMSEKMREKDIYERA
ncbi:hypothetical protein K2X40_00365 [Candidatus Babeliales bacterium]|nr:hypothetical protein [Candidatus Babeliales bacterium]